MIADLKVLKQQKHFKHLLTVQYIIYLNTLISLSYKLYTSRRRKNNSE